MVALPLNGETQETLFYAPVVRVNRSSEGGTDCLKADGAVPLIYYEA